MQLNLINYGLAFLEGFVLIISPCILPILPIMLSGSIEGGRKRPIGIIVGFVMIFALFTLFARSLVQAIGIDLDQLRVIAFVFIILFGIILISDWLSEKFSRFTQALANLGHQTSNKIQSNGFMSGVLLGGLISLIWVPCAGPILAAAIVQTAIQKTSVDSFFTFFSFALGSVVPMLIIALIGRTVVSKVKFLKTHTGLLRKILGVIIIIGALIAIFMPMETSGELTHLSNDEKPAEQNLTVSNAKNDAETSTSKSPNVLNSNGAENKNLINGLRRPYAAPSLVENSVWFNSPPLTIEKLRGKVVLIDFWTYSCINCIRTLPFLKQWYAKYHKDGFEIIGVHTPEFEFEKKPENVKEAVARLGIQYPVVLDNNYTTWINYRNHYWPAHYLIDKNGQVVYEHFGEGSYDVTEKNIQTLLGFSEKTAPIESSEKTKALAETPTMSFFQSPETYLGFAKAENFQSKEAFIRDQKTHYSYPQYLSKDGWALQGEWQVESEKIVSEAINAAIKINFYAKNVYVVMGSADGKPKQVKVLLNGQPIEKNGGRDLINSTLTVTSHRLYEVIHLNEANAGMLELITQDAGLEVFTFTFGS